ncbi:hypothetical protein [Actinoplanes sp. NPDC026619]|uniref:hypothetical protein n=1 Tax=Actinoplanes sp. NPDC026619 TaxID=3155798 RepID=UPI00340EC22A
MTTFREEGFVALKAEIDRLAVEVGTSAQRIASGGTWPETGVTQPNDDYAVWARVWRDEIHQAAESLHAISAGLAKLIEIIEQVDAGAAAALRTDS